MRSLAVSCLALTVGALLASSSRADVRPIELGRKHCDLFYESQIAALWANMSAAMRNVLGSEENLKAFRAQVGEQLGQEVAVVSEAEEDVAGAHIYLRTARFEKIDRLIHVQWAFDDAGVVTGFYVRPVQKEAPTEFLDYETKTTLVLPFEEEWLVVWGGRTVDKNQHAVAADQRFAYDILKTKDGATHEGEGKANEDYYCFGQRIFAPAAGVVVSAENAVDDNVPPGKMNPRQATGNHVIIDHGNGEYSFLAHLKRGSVAVRQLQHVESGDLLGLCGNSGNSSEAHLHYHLQNTPVFQEGQGLPAPFQNYVADGTAVSRGEPLRGQTIRREK
jgi:hypothetical protein